MDWTREVADSLWAHGRAMPDADPSTWRQDACGAWIRRSQFGHEQAEFGWTIVNVSAGAPDTAEHLRPFHWQNRFDRASNTPHCRTTADRAGVPAGEHAAPPRNRGV
jgi:hypothetical protein